jgi:RNA recognition motif-containing protein
LTKELEEYFGKFGPLQTLKLMSRTVDVEGEKKEELLGFGYVSFKTLEGS